MYSEQQQEKPCDKAKARSSDSPRQAGRFFPSVLTIKAIRFRGCRQDRICGHRKLEKEQQPFLFHIHNVGAYLSCNLYTLI